MKKISTLFKKDPTNLGRVINEVNPENQWVFDGEGVPTRKYDGTATAIIGERYINDTMLKGVGKFQRELFLVKRQTKLLVITHIG